MLGQLTFVALLFAGCGEDGAAPGADAGADAAPDTGPRMRRDAGPLCAHDQDAGTLEGPRGPSIVGVRTVELVDTTRDRTLPVEIWYPLPAGSTGTEGTPNVYRVATPIGVLADVCTSARRDAPEATGPHAAVLFSHGFGGLRTQSWFWSEHLASHGYVVVAMDHPGNTIADFDMLGDDAAVAQSAVDRPLDVLFVLERLIAADPLLPAADPDRIAVSGHSFGAWTSIESARRDTRLRVVIPFAPGFRFGSMPAIAGELARPLLIFGASEDVTTPFDTEQQPAYDAAMPPKAMVRINGAGHLDFSDLCAVSAARAFLDDGCDPTVLDPEIVHRRVESVGLPFLRRYLDGDTSADPLLEPSAVMALGNVDYWREP